MDYDKQHGNFDNIKEMIKVDERMYIIYIYILYLIILKMKKYFWFDEKC